jgi:predicted permease
MQNLRLAFRTLFKSPFITSVAILSLSLGIGANAAIYSLFDQILLRPLPVHEPGRLVNLGSPGPKPGSQSCGQAGDCDVVFSYPMFRDLEAADTPLQGVAAHLLFQANVAIETQTLNGEAVMVSGSYFPLLGVRPALGRLFGTDDDVAIGAHSVAVLGHAFWQNRLGANPDIIGETVTVNGQPLTVIGIAPASFTGTTLGARPLLYVPISMRGYMSPGFTGFDDRRSYWAYVFGRLAPGATMEQASAGINTVYRAIINDVEAPLQAGMSDQAMAQFRAKQVTLEDGRRGQSSVHREGRIPLLLLFAVTGVVLLIACANIANLLLARGANRGMEMAVRLSLGANRRHVLAQLLTESLVLALLGGIASLVVAQWTLAGIGYVMPPYVAETLQLQLSGGAIAFAGLLSIVTGLVFGLFPALHSTRSDLITTIRSSSHNLTGGRAASRFRSTLVTAQIALSMALLITAGLFLRSLTNVHRVELGLSPENVVAFSVSPQLNGYDPERSKQFFERLQEELAAIPGVTNVTASLVPILTNSNWGSSVVVEGIERVPDGDYHANLNMIGDAYFQALQVPLRAGREFTASDNAGAARVAIVNEAFARKFNLGNDAVGKRMGSGRSEELNMEIVGLVANASYSQVKDEVPPLFFTPWRQDDRVGAMTFYVRSTIEPAQILRSVPAVVARIDPHLPVEQLKTLTQQIRDNVFLDRMIGILCASFAALATILASIGLYGVLAYTVALRTPEIGVRMALGADRAMVRAMVLRQVGVMMLVGGVAGIAAALALGRVAGSLLYGVNTIDPMVVLAAAVVLGIFAFGAGFIPALRAASLDPVKALRWE